MVSLYRLGFDDEKMHVQRPLQLGSNSPFMSDIIKSVVLSISKSLGNVDNTSDLSKPISTATQSALDLKAPINSPTFTGIVSGITKNMVGLGNVDNTSDISKPISTATQLALDLKAPINNTTLTGTTTVSTLSCGNTVLNNNELKSGNIPPKTHMLIHIQKQSASVMWWLHHFR
jgi:hypothetical protein